VPSEYDLSAGPPAANTKNGEVDNKETKLEQIMERCFAEKAARISEIRVKYDPEIKYNMDKNNYTACDNFNT
jgi:hypothetical protein